MIKRRHVFVILVILIATSIAISPPRHAQATSSSAHSPQTGLRESLMPASNGSASSPAAATWGSGNLQVFTSAGVTGNLQHWWYSNGWYGPVLWSGGNDTGNPSVVSWGSGRLDVFSIYYDGTLLHWASTNSNPPQSLGGSLLTSYTYSPSAVSWASGRLDVFATGTDGTLQHWWSNDGTNWGGPESLGGSIEAGASPRAISLGYGLLDIFAVGTDSTMQHWWYNNGWHGPQSLGGPVQYTPGVSSWGGSRLDVFVQGTDYSLQHWWTNDDSTWYGPERVGTNIGSYPSAVSWGWGRVDIFMLSKSSRSLLHWWYNNGWHLQNLGSPGSFYSPAAISWSSGRLDVFTIGADSTLQHWWSNDGVTWGGPESLG